MKSTQQKILLFLTLMLSGRAMTIPYISRAGGELPTDPPAVWLMPLLGDAIIGVSALLVAYFIWKRSGLFAWVTIMVWNVVAIWDALSAFVINYTAPWPSFFMLEIFGSSMFFMATAMHLLCIYILVQPATQTHFINND